MKSAEENGRKEIGSICKALNVEKGNYKSELEVLNGEALAPVRQKRREAEFLCDSRSSLCSP